MVTNRLRLRRINKPKKPVLIARRKILRQKKAVYLQVANKSHKYPHGKNRIVYVGRTKTGQDRVAKSIAERVEDAFAEHGVNELEVHLYGCKAVQRIDSRAKLERALLILFRERYGKVPRLNTQGKKMKWEDELEYFSRRALEKVIEEWDEP